MNDGHRRLGARLKRRRAEAHVSIDELARRAGVERDAIDAFERGERRLGLGALNRIATVLGIEVGSLIHTSIDEVSAPPEPSYLLSHSANASLDTVDATALAAMIRRARSFASLRAIVDAEDLSGGFTPRAAKKTNAYLQGYALSGSVRQKLDNTSGPLRNIGRMLEDRFNILVTHHHFARIEIQGASARSGDARLVVTSTRLDEATSRFVLAHELCHQLADLTEYDAVTDIDEGPKFTLEHTPGEQRARAFARMLLAPTQGIAALIGPPTAAISTHVSARDVIRRVALHFGMPYRAAGWHLFALKYFIPNETFVAEVVAQGRNLATGFEPNDRGEDGLVRRVRVAIRRDAISVGRAHELVGRDVELQA